HFYWSGDRDQLLGMEQQIFASLTEHSSTLSENMNRRGGGIRALKIRTFDEDPEYFQFLIHFEPCASMGANYINSILENFASRLDQLFTQWFGPACELPDVLMSILSNYTPECTVQASVKCAFEDLNQPDIKGEEFAHRFKKAVDIARMDVYRATTHNKGIFNGVDAVVLRSEERRVGKEWRC